MKTKKKMSLFYKVYIILICLFLICLAGFSCYLYTSIEEYDKGLSETVSKKFFESNINKDGTDKVMNMANVSLNEFETTEMLKSHVTTLLSGDLSYTSISNTDGSNNKKYVVKSGESAFGYFTLSPDKNEDYSFSSFELITKRSGIEICALDSSKVFVNGKEVNDSYITRKEAFKDTEYLPQDVTKPQWLIYEIPDFLFEPSVSITDRNGLSNPGESIDGIICEGYVYDEPEQEIAELILEAAKQYAKCMQNETSKSSALKYYEKGTDLYESIRTSENTFVWDHNGYDFADELVSEFVRYDENTISVRVSFTHIMKKYGKENYEDTVDITFFARNIDGTYKIFSQHNNVA